MGGMLTQPVTNKKSDHGAGLGLKYGLSSMQGWRPEMEDAHDVKVGLKHGLNDWSFFAVFDGHAGKCAAAYAAWNLLDYILDETHNELKYPETTEEPNNADDCTTLTIQNEIMFKGIFNQNERSENKSEPDIKLKENELNSSSASSTKIDYTSQEQDHSGDKPSSQSSKSNDNNKEELEEKDFREEQETIKNSDNIVEQDSLSKSSTTMTTKTTSTTTINRTTPSMATERTTSTKETSEPNDKKDSINVKSETIIKTEQDANEGKKETSKFISVPTINQIDMVKNSIRTGFLRIDQSMRSKAQDMSGCTAVCALISPTHLFIANCGDSRAVLYDGTSTKFVTEDHKPFNPGERKRIIEAGGTATQRINGTLAVSRALGDFDFKKDLCRGPCEQLVSPEPEVTVIERQPTDEFLILACDGIWDVMNNNDLCKFVRYLLTIEENLETICSIVLDVCLRKGSRDNMSIIIVVFEGGPKVLDEEVARAKSNDQFLLELVDKFLEKTNDDSITDFNTLFEYLKDHLSKFNPDLFTPGAGLEAKYDILRDRYENKLELNKEEKK